MERESNMISSYFQLMCWFKSSTLGFCQNYMHHREVREKAIMHVFTIEYIFEYLLNVNHLMF